MAVTKIWNFWHSFLKKLGLTSDSLGPDDPSGRVGHGSSLSYGSRNPDNGIGHYIAGVGQSDGSNPIIGNDTLKNLPTLFGALTNWLNNMSGEHMTNAEVERNQMQMQNQEDIYQRQVTGMQSAGLNPALMYQSGAVQAPAVSTGNSSVGASMSDLLQAFMIKPQMRVMQAQAEMYKKEGDAALMNAGANVRNAGSNERQAGAAEMNAETNRMRQEIDAWKTKYDVQVDEATADKLAAETAQITLFTEQLPQRLAIMQQSADAQTKSAVASLQSALAATRQAAVAESLAPSEIALREARAYVEWANGDGQSIVNKYLDDKQMAEIKDLQKHAYMLDENAQYLHGEKKVQWMRTVTGYTQAACNIVNTGLGVATGMPARTAPIGFN